MSLIISVSGLRGIIGETLTPQVAMNYAAAYSAVTEPGAFVVTRDGRGSGVMLADAISAVLNSIGRAVLDAGITSTPTTGMLVRKLRAAGGIQISASHNPLEYNGLKLFSVEGRVIPKADGEKVKERYLQNVMEFKPYNKIGAKIACYDPISAHLDAVLETVNLQKIRKKKYKVLLDSNRGAGSFLGQKLLESLGCEVTILGKESDGYFEHPPEPIEENLQSVFAKVREAGVDVGFCQDPDADRLAVIDASGRFLGEEYTTAMCIDHVLRTREKGAVVINCASSRMSQDIAEKHGVPLFRSAVGEANVVDLMKEKNAVFGGEGNGGPIDPKVGFVRDSFVGMAQLLDAMAAREKTIAELAAELPAYSIVKRKIPLAFDRVPAAIAALEKEYAQFPRDRQDGLRIDFPNAWLLVRASNTEPIVRAIAEAQTESEANRLCDEAENLIGELG